MLTIEELASIPLYSKLPARELEHLAKRAADISLSAGEYAVHEGEERALFVLLAGKIEVTKRIDGMERAIGWRVPGKIFGEVPIALGGPFLGSYRAVEPSRVIRVEAQQYYAIAAVSPEIPEAIGALARERIGGLQGLAAEAPKAQVTKLSGTAGTAPATACACSSRNQIVFDWMTPDAPELAVRWPGPRPAEVDCPALRLADGTTLVRPQAREVARLVGLQTSARAADYDTVINERSRLLSGATLWKRACLITWSSRFAASRTSWSNCYPKCGRSMVILT